ncbi:MAG: hypothetical protein VX777_10565 [Chlamydiota bacterium]|nr:hypothetical protein [Chlamydiota bacterium]
MSISNVQPPQSNDFPLNQSEKRLPESCINVSRIALLIFSGGIGAAISYPGTFPEWDEPIYIFTNLGVICAYGTLGTWGSWMFFNRILDEINTKSANFSKKRAFLKAVRATISVGGGALAQIPIADLSLQFNGLAWAVFVELGGLWVPAYSLNCLIEEGLHYLAQAPALSTSSEKRLKLKIAQKLKSVFSNIILNSHLMTRSDNLKLHQYLIQNRLILRNTESTGAFFTSIQEISNTIFSAPPQRSKWNSIPRRAFQIIGLGGALTAITEQGYLAGDLWNRIFDSSPPVIILSTACAIPLSYYFVKGCWEGVGDLYDLVFDLCGSQKEKNYHEAYHLFATKGVAVLSLLMGLWPQVQTAYFSAEYVDPDTPMGITYIIGNILATTMLIYISMKELVQSFMVMGINHGLGGEFRKKMYELETELGKAITEIEDTPLQALYEIVNMIPDENVKQSILKDIDIDKIEELLKLAPRKAQYQTINE